MKRIAWVRPVVWCNRHDIAWASHSELGIWIERNCQQLERWTKDEEYTKKVGEPEQ